MGLPRFSPQGAHRAAQALLVLLVLTVFSGAAVRLTGSGLACPQWPQCNDQVITANTPQWIEFGNRLVSGAIGLVSVFVFFVMFRRTPRDRTLLRISALPPLGMAAEGALGVVTVTTHLSPGLVIAHFLLALMILVACALLVWRSSNPAGSRPLATDRVAVWGVRALMPLVSLLVVLGAFASGAGPHPGAAATGEVVNRIDWFGGETLRLLILRHGHLGTATFVLTTLLLFVLWRRDAPQPLLRRISLLLGAYAMQGAVGLYQYYNGLPAEAVWIHIALATIVWVLMLFAVFEAGRLEPKAVAARAMDPSPQR
ncbi:MAG: COX15/CtaA family protein [Patulibacter minatonensis]